MERLRAGNTGVQVEQAAGLGDGERDQVTPGLAGYEGRRGVCPGRGETVARSRPTMVAACNSAPTLTIAPDTGRTLENLAASGASQVAD